jgi:hypothetical protein
MAAPAHRLNLKKHRAPYERLTKSADRSGVGRAKEWAKAQDRFTLTPNLLLIEVQSPIIGKRAVTTGKNIFTALCLPQELSTGEASQ